MSSLCGITHIEYNRRNAPVHTFTPMKVLSPLASAKPALRPPSARQLPPICPREKKMEISANIVKLMRKKSSHKKNTLINLCRSDEYEFTEPDLSIDSVTDPDLPSDFVVMEKMFSDDLLDFL